MCGCSHQVRKEVGLNVHEGVPTGRPSPTTPGLQSGRYWGRLDNSTNVFWRFYLYPAVEVGHLFLSPESVDVLTPRGITLASQLSSTLPPGVLPSTWERGASSHPTTQPQTHTKKRPSQTKTANESQKCSPNSPQHRYDTANVNETTQKRPIQNHRRRHLRLQTLPRRP